MASRLAYLLTLALTLVLAGAGARPARDDERRSVILVMIDGLRWQEVFRGAADALLTEERGNIKDAAPILARYGGDSPSERRARLMPFLWSTIARDGAIFGNRDDGSIVDVTNGRFVSYPGYSETICGFADPTIEGNAKIVNPNRSVFEWLASKPAFADRVCAFGTWDVYPFIFARERSGIPVDDSVSPFTAPTDGPDLTPTIRTINRLRAEIPQRWPSGHFDALLFPVALEWIRVATPRVVFIGLGETDEWAHEGDYAHYLDAAHRADRSIEELWTTLQSMPEYRRRTTLIVTTDHGRGSDEAGPKEWNSHNARTQGSHQMWIALLGPDVPALGAVGGGDPREQRQIAATLARAVGEDWNAEEPRAAPAIELGRRD